MLGWCRVLRCGRIRLFAGAKRGCGSHTVIDVVRTWQRKPGEGLNGAPEAQEGDISEGEF